MPDYEDDLADLRFAGFHAICGELERTYGAHLDDAEFFDIAERVACDLMVDYPQRRVAA